MTRAPKSANIEAPKGDAIIAAASTTVTPLSGKQGSAVVVCFVALGSLSSASEVHRLALLT